MVSEAEDLLDSMVPLVRPFTLKCVSWDEYACFPDVHIDRKRDIADLLGTESSIFYFQGFPV
jgi:hypothetical protein